MESVDIMIRSSQDVIRELIDYGVDFAKEDGELVYTREGCHSKPRILFHEDITGEEITGKLLKEAKKQKHITIMEHMTMLDLVEKKQQCHGVVAVDKEGEAYFLKAGNTILASGGIGGLYKHSTNYPHLTGDALAIAMRHHVELEHIDYIQIHPTTFILSDPAGDF